MKKFSIIIASLLFFAGATFAQQTGTMPAAKSGSATDKTAKNGTASGTTTPGTAVKKVPATKGKATPATKATPTPAPGK